MKLFLILLSFLTLGFCFQENSQNLEVIAGTPVKRILNPRNPVYSGFLFKRESCSDDLSCGTGSDHFNPLILGTNTCCPAGSFCCAAITDGVSCKAPGTFCCGDGLCDNNQVCCNGETCCGSGFQCCGRGCCKTE